MQYLGQRKRIVVCFVLTVMLSVHRSKRVIMSAVHVNLNSICRIGISNYCIDLELLAEGESAMESCLVCTDELEN